MTHPHKYPSRFEGVVVDNGDTHTQIPLDGLMELSWKTVTHPHKYPSRFEGVVVDNGDTPTKIPHILGRCEGVVVENLSGYHALVSTLCEISRSTVHCSFVSSATVHYSTVHCSSVPDSTSSIVRVPKPLKIPINSFYVYSYILH